MEDLFEAIQTLATYCENTNCKDCVIKTRIHCGPILPVSILRKTVDSKTIIAKRTKHALDVVPHPALWHDLDNL